MYSAAMSPPRWPVPRPSSRSLDKNLTWVRMRCGSMAFMAAMADGGNDEAAGCDAGRLGFEVLDLCAPSGAAERARITIKRAALRMKEVPRFYLLRDNEAARCCRSSRLEGGATVYARKLRS